THGVHSIGEQIHFAQEAVASVTLIGPALGLVLPSMLNGVFGVFAGALAVVVMAGIRRLRGQKI
ncbi:MAG: DUF808 domain-containing protein, partial [Shewanella sp.]